MTTIVSIQPVMCIDTPKRGDGIAQIQERIRKALELARQQQPQVDMVAKPAPTPKPLVELAAPILKVVERKFPNAHHHRRDVYVHHIVVPTESAEQLLAQLEALRTTAELRRVSVAVRSGTPRGIAESPNVSGALTAESVHDTPAWPRASWLTR